MAFSVSGGGKDGERILCQEKETSIKCLRQTLFLDFVMSQLIHLRPSDQLILYINGTSSLSN